MKRLGEVQGFRKRERHVLTIDGVELLLIHRDNRFYLIDNKCGHFSVPLLDARITGTEIRCSRHGIVFSLVDGSVCTQTPDDCDPLRVYTVIEKQGCLYFE